MSFTLSWIMSAIDGIADFARSALPWQYRPLASNWAVFSAIFGSLAVVLGLLHFALRERPKIAWNFEKTGYPVRLNWSNADGVITYHVDGIELGGENISGHALHQIDAEITLARDGRHLPVFVIINRAWAHLNELDGIPSRAMCFVGVPFRADGVNLPNYPTRMTPDQFLRDFGGFTFSITIDGDKKFWSFTIDDLRKQFEAQQRDAEEDRLKNPMNRPQLKRKQA
jgi:hypothetical protein